LRLTVIEGATMSKTVMLVDDSPTVRRVMRFALERAGFTVIEACDGDEALNMLDGKRLSAVVCDVAMPKMDGLSFLKEMRARQNYKFTPVVMLTTETRAERKQVARDAGAQAWATKPCQPSELVDIITRLAV
jgi:two-component system chemotaxis response regulator CheY